jgi:hypothetical protein
LIRIVLEIDIFGETPLKYVEPVFLTVYSFIIIYVIIVVISVALRIHKFGVGRTSSTGIGITTEDNNWHKFKIIFTSLIGNAAKKILNSKFYSKIRPLIQKQKANIRLFSEWLKEKMQTIYNASSKKIKELSKSLKNFIDKK